MPVAPLTRAIAASSSHPARAVRSALAIVALAALVALPGCSSGASPDKTLDLGSGPGGTSTAEPSPSPVTLVIVTPEVWPTPFATAVAGARATPRPAVVATPSAIPTAASPTPEATIVATPSATVVATPPVGPTPAVDGQSPELASSLSERLTALVQALAARDAGRALKAQQDLLAEADRVEAGLRTDESAQADLVRQAIQEIRAGAAGDAAKLGSAAAKLRIASGQPPSGADNSIAVAGAVAMASSLQSKLAAFDQARKDNRIDDLLKLQQDLLAETSRDEKAIAGEHSDTADKLRSALQDLKSALSGDESKLVPASAALQSIAGAPIGQPPSQPAAAPTQLRDTAANLDGKLANLQEALSGGGQDQLLQAQRELLDALARARDTVQGDNSDAAKRLSDAISLTKQGAAGDSGKLDEARSRLADFLGTSPANTGQSAQPGPSSRSVRPSDLPGMADDLSRKVDSYKEALRKGDRGELLRLQQELTDQLGRDQQAVRGISGKQADQLRSAFSDLHDALSGDLSKLNSANAGLRLVAAGSE